MIYIFYVKRTHRVLIVRESDNVYSNDREISQNKDDEKEEVNELARKVKEKLREIYILTWNCILELRNRVSIWSIFEIWN